MRLKSFVLSLVALGAMAMPLLYAAPAQAQASRTWVSGVGDDVNPCSRTAPCKTWAGAISKTAPGGEIDALDPGGFGAVTITKSITLDGGGGQVASIVVAGTNAIVVQAGASDVVIIKNVRFQGLFGNGGNPANSGQTAIVFNAGSKLVVENCEIYGFAVNGITVNAAAFAAINNTQIMNVGNAGISVAAVAAQVEVDSSRIYGSKFGVAVGNTAKMMFSNSVSSKGSTSGLEADGGSTLTIDNSVISFSAQGIIGATQSFQNNRLVGNTSDGTAPTPITGTDTNPRGMK
jgi:Right handed beta helix region